MRCLTSTVASSPNDDDEADDDGRPDIVEHERCVKQQQQCVRQRIV